MDRRSLMIAAGASLGVCPVPAISPSQRVIPVLARRISSQGWSLTDKSADVTSNKTSVKKLVSTTNFVGQCRGELGVGSGKWYFEYKRISHASGGWAAIGFSNDTHELTGAFLGSGANSIGYFSDGRVLHNGSTLTTIQTYADGDWIGVCVDKDNDKLWFKNLTMGSSWNNSGAADPATNAGGIAISITGTAYPTWDGEDGGSTPFDEGLANWGDSSFVGTIRAGYRAF